MTTVCVKSVFGLCDRARTGPRISSVIQELRKEQQYREGTTECWWGLLSTWYLGPRRPTMFLDIGQSGKAAVTSHQFPPHGYPRVHIHGPTVSRVSPTANRWTPSESVGPGAKDPDTKPWSGWCASWQGGEQSCLRQCRPPPPAGPPARLCVLRVGLLSCSLDCWSQNTE